MPVVRLDDDFAGDLMPSAIEIDTEGCEMNVLRGCTNILRNGFSLIIEAHRAMRGFGGDPYEFDDLLVHHGFKARAAPPRRDDAEPSREEVAALNSYILFRDPA